MEMADGIVITKADGDNKIKCERARQEYKNALHLFPPSPTGWYPPVLTCSAVLNEGLEEIWEKVGEFANLMKEKGFFQQNRKYQNIQWMHDIILYSLRQRFYADSRIKQLSKDLEKAIEAQKIPAISAARKLLDEYFNS